MTDYTDLIARMRAKASNALHDEAANAIEALQRENARLSQNLNLANRRAFLAYAKPRVVDGYYIQKDWGIFTLQQMQAERERQWGTQSRVGFESARNYPDSIGGEVTPLANQADGDKGFT